MKHFICLILAVAMLFCVTGCFSSVSSDDNSGTIKPDHWYHYTELDIVNVQNCYVSDAFIRNAGGVFVTYYPVCKSCHETGIVGTAIVSEEESYMKTYYCDCGERTGVIIKIIV